MLDFLAQGDRNITGRRTPAPIRNCMGIRMPNLGVFLTSLGVGALAIYLENVAVAAVCFSIAAFYTALIFWQWRRRRKSG
jgi:membrane protein implicated in regulation of membrane protease activity